jgi:hypothetical protein
MGSLGYLVLGVLAVLAVLTALALGAEGASAGVDLTPSCFAYFLTITSNMLVRLRNSRSAHCSHRSRTSGVILSVVVSVFSFGRAMVRGVMDGVYMLHDPGDAAYCATSRSPGSMCDALRNWRGGKSFEPLGL